MSGRDPLVEGPIGAVAAAAAGWVGVCLLIPPLTRHLLEGAVFVAFASVCWGWARAGHARAAGPLFVGVTAPALVWAMADDPSSGHLVVCLPPLSILVVGWWGPWAGATAVIFTSAALFVVGPPQAGNIAPLEHAGSLLLATVSTAALMGPLMGELRSRTTDARLRAESADRAARIAAVDEEARDRFLAAVSHELRTPLDAVQGYTEMLLEEERDPERRDDLDRVRKASIQLAALVDDMLDMARDEGELGLTPTAVQPDRLLRDVVDTAAPIVGRNENRLVVEWPDDLPEIWTDERRTRQILLNLLSNAAKYTHSGTITLAAALSGSSVRFEVRDTGVGFPADRVPDLFRPFVQLHDGSERRAGVGLGLALSQRLAQRLGGRIIARSEVGKGSLFGLELPLSARQNPPQTVAASIR